jgi:hypothetical protein
MNPVDTITSLAMLKVNADLQNRDYLDYLLPFVNEAISHLNGKPVNSPDIRSEIRRTIGLRIPTGPVDLILRRMAKRNLLIFDHGVYYKSPKFQPVDLAPKRVAANQSMTRVINGIVAFAEAKGLKPFNAQRAAKALTSYLARFCIDCLRTHAQGTALPRIESPKYEDLFVVNGFIQNALEHDRDLFEDIVVLVKGHMLANALICPDLESLQRKFGDVTFYLDTPFILRLVRAQGEPLYAASIELLDLLKRLRANLAVFNHTAQEVHQVLTGCEKLLEQPTARARVVIEMRKAGKTRSDLILIRSGLDSFYGSHGIVRCPSPKYTLPFQIDETILGGALDEEVKYCNPRALEYDVNSIRSIYVLRKGIAPTRLEDARAVLVTTNSRLARVAYEYGQQHESTREVSSVITDFSLGNVAWLKAPLSSDLPRREIIATCYAAMEPPPHLWSKYLAEIDKLRSEGRITAADHEALRLSLRAREELMNLTLGQEEIFSAGTITDILNIVRQEFTREHLEKLDNECAAHAETKSRLLLLESEREEQRKSLFQRAAKFGKFAGNSMLIFLTLVLVGAALAGATITDGQIHNFWVASGVNVIIAAAAVWAILNATFGVSIVDLSKSLRTKITASRYTTLCHKSGILAE